MSDLRPLYREMVETGDNFQGLSLLQHSGDIGQIVRDVGAVSVLDFGSGRGNAYLPPYEVHKAWGIERPTLYDPAFKTHDTLPPDGVLFDLVICSDVLEHIPEPQVKEFVFDLFELSSKFVWASVCCRLAKKCFPDGRNLHVTVRPLDWWCDVFAKEAAHRRVGWVLRETP